MLNQEGGLRIKKQQRVIDIIASVYTLTGNREIPYIEFMNLNKGKKNVTNREARKTTASHTWHTLRLSAGEKGFGPAGDRKRHVTSISSPTHSNVIWMLCLLTFKAVAFHFIIARNGPGGGNSQSA